MMLLKWEHLEPLNGSQQKDKGVGFSSWFCSKTPLVTKTLILTFMLDCAADSH